VDRIKKISMEILETYKEKFGTDFRENKKIIDDIAIVRSKGLKNQLAGFITRFIKREIRQNEEKLAKEAKSGNEERTSEEQSASTNQEEPLEVTETVSENKSEESSSGNKV
jgi:small subunit ribosomal protein S17e